MLFVNAKIMTMEGQDIPEGFLRVQDGKIAGVGEMGALSRRDGEEELDLGGGYLLPGFVDAHSHLGLTEDGLGLEGDDLNEFVDPCTPHLRAVDGVNPMDRCFTEALEAGITCVVVAPGSANPVGGQIAALKTHGKWVDRMAIAQPLAVKFALGENPKMVYGEKSQSPLTRMATAAIIREQLYKARRYGEDLARAEEDEENPPEYDARCEALLPLLRGEIRAHFHAHKAYDILSAVRIAQEFSLRYTLIHCTEGHLIADILGELGTSAVCGPLICARTKPELVNLSPRNCGKLLEAGVNVAICSDHPEVPAHFLRASAEAAEGLSPRQRLEAITIGAARAVGLEDRVGSLAKGKDADLLLFRADPLSTAQKPDAVWIRGERVLSFL